MRALSTYETGSSIAIVVDVTAGFATTRSARRPWGDNKGLEMRVKRRDRKCKCLRDGGLTHLQRKVVSGIELHVSCLVVAE